MRPVALFLALCFLIGVTGCQAIRPAPTEAQKQNAWLLKNEARQASNLAIQEGTSANLQALASATADDSENVTMYFGAPKNPLPAATVGDITSDAAEANREQTKTDAAHKVGPAEIAAAADEGLTRLEAVLLALGIGGTGSGLWITRLRNALKAAAGNAEVNQVALAQVVRNNEKFLATATAEAKDGFLDAQGKQNAATKHLVTEIRGDVG